MEEKNDMMEYKSDDVMLPGFRFHPTDEELVGFYLRRKIQQRPLPIELIKQVDIYKYDPWDLPKLATSGEKEWYFYCPRDRKYRNSARPNRVTGAGFWKATGTDRPIYSSDGTKCIGLKKSLVFYRGRAAKGLKTDWMMHEFRLPSLGEPSTPKKFLDKSLPPNDAWAICRIFKKTNSMAQRALSQTWISQLEDTSSPSEIFSNQFTSDNIPSFSASEISPSYRPINSTLYKPSFPSVVDNNNIPSNFMFSPIEISTPTKSTPTDTSPMLLNSLMGDTSKLASESTGFEVSHGHFNEFLINLSPQSQMDLKEDIDACSRKTAGSVHENGNWGSARSIGFPFSLASEFSDDWKPNLPWDSPPCPSEMSTSTYPTSKCYT